MDQEKQLGYIYTSLNSLIEEMRILNSLLKPKKETSPEYYRILNPEKVSKKDSKVVENINIDEGNTYEKTDFSSYKKKEKNLSLSYIESSVSRDYLMKRLSYIARKGKGKEISKILNRYEAITFSDLKPKYYKDVLREAEVLIR